MECEDPFLWLEDIQSEKVLRWVDEENIRLSRFLGPLPSRLMPRIEKYYEIPYVYIVRLSDRGYYILMKEQHSYKIKLLRRDGDTIDILDSHQLGKDAVINYFFVNREGDRLAYYYSYAGSDIGTLKVLDTETLEAIDQIDGAVCDVVWIDKERFYYVLLFRNGETPDGVKAPTERVYLRDGERSEVVFGVGLQTSHFISLSTSIDGKKLFATVSYGWTWSDVYAGDISNPDEWRLIYGESKFIVKPVDYVQGKFYLAAYDDKTELGRILEVDQRSKRVVVDAWKYPLRWASVVGNKIIAHYLVNAASMLRIYDLNGRFIKEIKFTPPGSLSSFDRLEDEAVFKYESFFIPYRVYRLQNCEASVILSEHITNDFEINEDWVKSSDNTPIHMFVVKQRTLPSRHVLIYGYGGFGLGLTPRFYPHVIPFIEDGGTFVVVNIRGGDEYGEKWHRAGMRENKQNVFNDFMAAIRYFKEQGARVVAWGVSNGGLLVGAILTQQPNLLDGAVIGYPVLDMLRFHKLYIGKAWIPEYGNPDNPHDRQYLIKYSPYHNIKRNKYPPTLVYTGLHDDRVHPGHAFKFVAKLKEVGAEVYLRTEKLSGHLGASPEVKVRELVESLSFVYKVLGLSPG